ncbi:unnamed protein product [Periconia digitata]|uniref:Uncharacterized protein n=1 Tax=Periconia digitata TaxID=1303443 RepID=A0A9W4U8N7_9PLEO|nr:unnamed protein product [Periconia digitata]
MNDFPLYCQDIGDPTKPGLDCCYPDNPSSSACQAAFDSQAKTFGPNVCSSGNCLEDCSNVSTIYQSILEIDGFSGNGYGPKRRFATCVNVPAMAGYLSQSSLPSNITSAIGSNISPRAAESQLRRVTSAVTECLTMTCRNARSAEKCRQDCSAVNMLHNSTQPNLQGVDQCLTSLCSTQYDSLPFADADVVGIGVFTSYIMQCMLVVVIWFALSTFTVFNRKGRERHPPPLAVEGEADNSKSAPRKHYSSSKEEKTHQEVLESFLLQFHKAQCYFSATIQIASLSYNIFNTNLLMTFMLTPLATNGVLPVVFAYMILIHCKKATPDVTLLTITCWLLSSIVFWTLYHGITPINNEIQSEIKRYRAYQQFMYKLSAIDECGGFSGLAVCPENNVLGREDITAASRKLRALTPIIWSFATACLLGMLAPKCFTRRNSLEKKERRNRGENRKVEIPLSGKGPHYNILFLGSLSLGAILYVVLSLLFLAGVGMQLSLLSIGTSLNMMDRTDWGFGQVVAISVWIPPLLGYLYEEMSHYFGFDQN